jgi:hypothetical protein
VVFQNTRLVLSALPYTARCSCSTRTTRSMCSARRKCLRMVCQPRRVPLHHSSSAGVKYQKIKVAVAEPNAGPGAVSGLFTWLSMRPMSRRTEPWWAVSPRPQRAHARNLHLISAGSASRYVQITFLIRLGHKGPKNIRRILVFHAKADSRRPVGSSKPTTKITWAPRCQRRGDADGRGQPRRPLTLYTPREGGQLCCRLGTQSRCYHCLDPIPLLRGLVGMYTPPLPMGVIHRSHRPETSDGALDAPRREKHHPYNIL